MSFGLRNKFLGHTIGRFRLSIFPPKVRSGPLEFTLLPLVITLSSVENEAALLSYDIISENYE